jgi:hypothetical protein
VTAVCKVPASLDDHTFEEVLNQVATHPPEARLLLDARHTRWASPYGLTALLTLAQTRETRPTLTVPELEQTASYWARTGFFHHADTLYDLHGSYPRRVPDQDSRVLLRITPVTGSEDVHAVVDRIQDRAQAILTSELRLDARHTLRFTMTLSEICQNIVEHAGCGGWVAVQTYEWTQRLGRTVAVIAVCDAGTGFRKSFESNPNFVPPGRWGDATALEMALLQGASRFRERGRGHGLAASRKYVGQWSGKLSIRSGTASIAIVPDWDRDVPLREGLAPFAGSQVQVIIPERLSQENGQ